MSQIVSLKTLSSGEASHSKATPKSAGAPSKKGLFADILQSSLAGSLSNQGMALPVFTAPLSGAAAEPATENPRLAQTTDTTTRNDYASKNDDRNAARSIGEEISTERNQVNHANVQENINDSVDSKNIGELASASVETRSTEAQRKPEGKNTITPIPEKYNEKTQLQTQAESTSRKENTELLTHTQKNSDKQQASKSKNTSNEKPQLGPEKSASLNESTEKAGINEPQASKTFKSSNGLLEKTNSAADPKTNQKSERVKQRSRTKLDSIIIQNNSKESASEGKVQLLRARILSGSANVSRETKTMGSGLSEIVNLKNYRPNSQSAGPTASANTKKGLSGAVGLKSNENVFFDSQSAFKANLHSMKTSSTKAGASLPAHVNPKEIQEQVLKAFRKARLKVLDSKNAKMDLQLYPKELGRVQIHLSLQDGIIQGRFTVENEAIAKLVEMKLAQMSQELQRDGVHVQSFDVFSGSASNAQGGFSEKENKSGIQDGINLASSSLKNAETLSADQRVKGEYLYA